eukprot:2344300-Prymnesium_polylepis.1
MEKGIKGINIRGHRYKLSHFADDATVLLGSKREIKLANAAIQRCTAAKDSYLDSYLDKPGYLRIALSSDSTQIAHR